MVIFPINGFFCIKRDNIDFFSDASGLFQLRIEAINVTADALKGISVPSVLESRILKQYPLSAGDFLFIEWEKLAEDILVTSDRSALISAHTCILASFD